MLDSDIPTESNTEYSSARSSSSEEAFTEDEKIMVKRAKKGNKYHRKLRSGIRKIKIR